MKFPPSAHVLDLVVLGAIAVGMLAAFPGARAHPPSIVNQAAEKIVADEVRAFRKEMAAAIKAKDAARLRQMYAPSFVHTHSNGRADERDTRIGTARSGVPMIETADVTDLEIRIPIDWVAVATGTTTLKSATNGTTQRVRWMAVYTRTDKSWWLVASQETPLSPQ